MSLDRQQFFQDLKHITQRVLLFFVSTIIATLLSFTFIEVGFRIYAKVNNIDFRLYQKELINTDRLPAAMYQTSGKPWEPMTPNGKVLVTTSDFSVVYQFNSFGYRDQEYSRTKPDGKTRILVLGDSFTFGEGVPEGERFADILEHHLSNVEVINLGVPGSGIDSEYLQYREFAKDFHPDYVVVAANWIDAERNSKDIYRDGKIDLSPKPVASTSAAVSLPSDTTFVKREESWWKFTLPFSQHSYFLSYLEYKISVMLIRGDLINSDAHFWIPTRRLVDRKITDAEHKVVVNKTTAILRALKQEVERDNAKLILVNIDGKTELKEIADQVPDLTYFSYQSQLAKFGETHPLSFTYDHHYRPETNKEIGKLLSSDMKKYLEQQSSH